MKKFGEISKTQQRQREQLEVSLESEYKLQNNNKMLLHFTNDTSSVVMVQKHVIDSDPEENGGGDNNSRSKAVTQGSSSVSSFPRGGSISEYDSSSCDEGEVQLSQVNRLASDWP